MTVFQHRQIAAAIATTATVVHQDERASALVAHSLARELTQLSANGALVAKTGQFTGRSARDKFIVADSVTRDAVWWDNVASMRRESFDRLLLDMLAWTADKPMFSQRLHASADPALRLTVDVFSESAWHSLFIRHLLIRPEAAAAAQGADITILHLPGFSADPEVHGTRSGTCVALDLSRNIVLICGTAYAGEIKKAVFSIFCFHAPARDILPMHCAANIGPEGDTALFFGLSGTGKTTLSTDPRRRLIGDDEHGWSGRGIFNLEGGCYAKTAALDPHTEPDIFAAAGRFATILENVVLCGPDRQPDFHDLTITENTRAAYPLEALANIAPDGQGPAPKNVFFLTADAFGIMPPVARLSPEQAVYHFLSGYTARIAGTERGVTTPQATFSACFGAPFMARHPAIYATLFRRLLDASGAQCWLINTGWTGGAYGVGQRIGLPVTRLLLRSILGGFVTNAPMRIDPTFGFEVPLEVDGVPSSFLNPVETWPTYDAWRTQATGLAALFHENFTRLGSDVEPIRAAGPIVGGGSR
jgi:phosphoenolpyruvate carboxykinase (ATP)